MKQSKIFVLTVAVALSIFTIGCTESDELTEITPSHPQQEQEDEPEPEPEPEPLSDEFSEQLAALGFTDVQVSDTQYGDNKETTRSYTFFFNQLVDHFDASKGTFKQRVRIRLNTAKDLTSPVVLYTHGYNMPAPTSSHVPELTNYLNANTVYVEHRYFDKSLPEPFENLDFTYLNADQAAQDMHAIVSLLKTTFFKNSGKWLSTGVSKDGITTGLYAYYSDKYGWDDIDLYMPFCAPYLKATPTSCDDPKMGQYLYEESGKGYPVGSQEYIAYQRIHKIPTSLLQDKELRDACMRYFHQKDVGTYLQVINYFGRSEENATAALLTTYFNNLFEKFSYVLFKKWSSFVPDVDAAIAPATTETEKANKAMAVARVAEFVFMNRDELFSLINNAQGQYSNVHGDGAGTPGVQEPYTYTDEDLLYLRYDDLSMPYFVQAARELGNVRLDFSALDGLNFPGSSGDFGFLAATISQQYEISTLFHRYANQWDGGALMKSFLQWVKTQNKYNMIFCYSANDPWTGGAIDESTNPKVKRFICRNGTHNDYFLKPDYYSEAEKQELLGYVNSYLGM